MHDPHYLRRMAVASVGALDPGYKASITDTKSRQRYKEKLGLLGGRDPYKIPRSDWQDNMDLWPSTMYIHVGMYLVFSGDDLLNYRSLECYQRFTAGWVRDILVSAKAGGQRVLTAKVSCDAE